VDIPTFLLERNQSEFENQVEINLTESGVHPQSVGELLKGEDLSRFLQLRVGYGHTEYTPELREAIATWYPGASARNVFRYPHALSSKELCERLRLEASALIVAGEWFGMDGYLRVGIGGEEGKIRVGLERLAKLLDALPID
jgi:aspartate/methionine/tyrosine aminotransferase